MTTYNNIHRQQLFYWLGRHIDERVENGKLTEELRGEYLECLRSALRHGLWVKTPQVPDQLGDGSLIKVHRPITCFTEWTLGQSVPHTTRYGRMGLGFPKKFVLNRGGQPVTYLRDSSRNDPYSTALKALAKGLSSSDANAIMKSAKVIRELQEHFDFLAHFNKRIKHPPQPRTKSAKVTSSKKKVASSKEIDPFSRRFGPTLHYLEEREWRIVYDESIRDFFEPGPGGVGKPDYYLPFKKGEELFTLVLPDNKTVHDALEDSVIRKALYPADAPHVTVLSLQDIGTF